MEGNHVYKQKNTYRIAKNRLIQQTNKQQIFEHKEYQ